MSQSVDPRDFFQTDASESTRARKAAKSSNKNGNPIVLPSKILGVVPDPFSSTCIYLAESAGCVRVVNVETKVTKTVYRGPSAPVTSIAIGGPNNATIFAGCWDKDIWSWDRETKVTGRRYKGHSDFVKAIICAKIGGKDCLISGGADSKIIVWDTAAGERLHTLRDKTDSMMSIQDLALDPKESTSAEIVLVSASSDPYIRRWRISLSSASQILDSADTVSTEDRPPRTTILEHETSVYKILFSDDDEDMDLWTASADGTTKCLSRARNWATEDTYDHGDFVKAVGITANWVITAGRNEDVKIWDRASGKLWHVYEGHYEEVTGLVVLEGEKKVVSVSIDRTVRVWELGKKELEAARKEQEDKGKEVKQAYVEPKKTSLLTPEEEAELAELMDSDDE